MSLDVYLIMPDPVKRPGSGIFVRDNGSTREISREEWNAKFPRTEPIIARREDETHEVYSANITHNLGKMAVAAEIYKALWAPEELQITQARQLIPLLRAGLGNLHGDPNHFKTFNPSNGWGDYDGLVDFVTDYLAACEQNPDAEVEVSR